MGEKKLIAITVGGVVFAIIIVILIVLSIFFSEK